MLRSGWSWYRARPKWQGILMAIIALFLIVGAVSAVGEYRKTSSADYAAGLESGEGMAKVYEALTDEPMTFERLDNLCFRAGLQTRDVDNVQYFKAGCEESYKAALPERLKATR